jgi:pimeloyl-ACP methyl ester carboxylesterase
VAERSSLRFAASKEPPMPDREFSFTSAADGMQIEAYAWQPAAAPSMLVVIAHGAAEHAMRYERFARALNAAGIEAWAHDHRGHGKTAGLERRGDFGAGGWDALVADTAQFIELARAERPGVPVVLFGHSMGSSVAQQYAPDGSRSISLAHPQAGYGGTGLADYLATQRAQPPLLVAQIETAETDDTLADIAGAGADALFHGTTDLSVDLGLDDNRLRARVDEVADAAAAAGLPLGAFALDDERVDFHVSASDLSLLRTALANAA